MICVLAVGVVFGSCAIKHPLIYDLFIYDVDVPTFVDVYVCENTESLHLSTHPARCVPPEAE